MDFELYKKFLEKEYPSSIEFLKTNSQPLLLFSNSVSLAKGSYNQMKKIVQTLFQLKQEADYQKKLSSFPLSPHKKSQNMDSVLMAYDFHLKESIPYLIEVNTNASGFLLVNSLYQFQKLPYKSALKDLKESFQSEWYKFSQSLKPPRKSVLIDEKPEHQKMVLEFFMYKDLFKSMGWDLEICDSQSLKTDDKGFLYTKKGEPVDFIYNRSTDFYFENHPHLARAYQEGSCAISPHPKEYFLLSDKDRLCEWSSEKNKWESLKAISNHLPFSKILNSENKEEAWQNRKKYFFKSRKSYGGKRAYRGSNLTIKKFNELCDGEILFQEYIPPSISQSKDGKEWKTDFRLYVYEDQIQQIVARCYQGQLTNFRQPGSGFAPVVLA